MNVNDEFNFEVFENTHNQNFLKTGFTDDQKAQFVKLRDMTLPRSSTSSGYFALPSSSGHYSGSIPEDSSHITSRTNSNSTSWSQALPTHNSVNLQLQQNTQRAENSNISALKVLAFPFKAAFVIAGGAIAGAGLVTMFALAIPAAALFGGSALAGGIVGGVVGGVLGTLVLKPKEGLKGGAEIGAYFTRGASALGAIPLLGVTSLVRFFVAIPTIIGFGLMKLGLGNNIKNEAFETALQAANFDWVILNDQKTIT